MKSHFLLDIPDLPIGAFEHCGNRKVKLFGPAAAVVNAVADTASSVVNTVANVASDVVNKAVNVVDSAVTSAVNDPIGTIAKVAAVATGNAELLPAISAADTIANGGNLGQALSSAAVSEAGLQAGQYVSGALTGTPADASAATTDTGAAAAPSDTSSGLSPTTIKAASAAASGATQAALSGGNPIAGAVNAAASNYASGALNSAVNAGGASGGTPSDTPTTAPTDTPSAASTYVAPVDTTLTPPVDTTSGVQAPVDTSATTNLTPPIDTTSGVQLPADAGPIAALTPTVPATPVAAPTPADTTTPVAAPTPAANVNVPVATAPTDTGIVESVSPVVDTTPLDVSLAPVTGSQVPLDTTASYNLANATPVAADTGNATYSQSPNLTSMNGGQGVTVPTVTGTTSAIGTTATGSSPNLGDPNSIINNPNVTGTPVAPTDTSTNIPTPSVSANLIPAAAATSLTKLGGSASSNTATPTQQVAQPEQQSSSLISDTAPAPLNPLLFSLAGFQTPRSKTTDFGDLSLLTSIFHGAGDGDLSPLQADVTTAPTYTPASTYAPTTVASAATGNDYVDPAQNMEPLASYAQGGLTMAHPAGEPQFHSQGGLGNMHVKGDGDGTSDSIPAMVARDEFVLPADVVAALGNGSSDAGASKLDEMVKAIRSRAHSASPSELPPSAHQSPLDYLKKDRA